MGTGKDQANTKPMGVSSKNDPFKGQQGGMCGGQMQVFSL
jgi:hypothetical protein